MVERQNIENFVKYNYIPFNKRQCIVRMILIWILSAVVYAIAQLCGKRHAFWIIANGMIVFAVSVVFLLLCIKQLAHKIIARFLCDGLFCLTLSILLVFSSYILLTINVDKSWHILVLLLLFLLVSIIITLIAINYNIKTDKYKGTNNAIVSFSPLIFGFLGFLTARIFLQGQPQQTTLQLLSVLLILLSFLIGMGSTILLKAFLTIRFNIH